MKASLFFASITVLGAAYAQNTTTTSSGVPAQVSPTWLSDVKPIAGSVQSYPTGDNTTIPTGALGNITFDFSAYPSGWAAPPTNSSEVQAVVAAIDWTKVPGAAVRKVDANGALTLTGYDATTDPDCWWSASTCVTSKNPLVPQDAYACPQAGYWGLTYDDGPLTAEGGEWAEPNLYDFLAAHNNQKASLFYIGSNVIAAPAAAQRGLADGHTLCVHTWSHPYMTAQSNEAVVAELYWTIRAIKEVTGVTTKCWRPPFGDVDDRVRAIAWQMGLTTVLWDEDTNDWNMPGDGGGNLAPETVDGYFEGWINSYKNGTDKEHGHIVLQHELNNSTVSMAEKWLPDVQSTFKVVPWNYCYNVSTPYWETNFVYPTSENPNGNATTVVTTAVSSQAAATSTVSSVEPAAATTKAASVTAGAAKSVSSSTVSMTFLLGMIVMLMSF